LLRDLDIEAPSGGGAGKAERDYFDFSVDSNDVKKDVKGKNNAWGDQGQMQSRDRESQTPTFSNNVAPKMEDFASFEQYLDALVSHERSAISGSNNGNNFNSKKPVSQSNGPRATGGGKGANFDVDALDYDLIDFLGGDEGVDSNANSKNIRKGATTETPPKVRSWSPSPKPQLEASFSNNKNENSKEFESEYDDLNSFLDELENSNVLPSKLEKETSSKVIEDKVPTPIKAVKKAASEDIVIDNSKSDSSASESFSSLTVVALKNMLKAKGLPVSGAKAELIQRLSSN
jgi:hypothetical protein